MSTTWDWALTLHKSRALCVLHLDTSISTFVYLCRDLGGFGYFFKTSTQFFYSVLNLPCEEFDFWVHCIWFPWWREQRSRSLDSLERCLWSLTCLQGNCKIHMSLFTTLRNSTAVVPRLGCSHLYGMLLFWGVNLNIFHLTVFFYGLTLAFYLSIFTSYRKLSVDKCTIGTNIFHDCKWGEW